MYGKGKILIGLGVFLALVTFPFYSNLGKVDAVPEPSLDTPVINAMSVKECVESEAFMESEHMQLLNHWRDMLVREGQKTYVNSKGKEFDISLQNTCLNCHSNKEQFCDRCHNYLAVKPYCWDCHFGPKETNWTKETDV